MLKVGLTGGLASGKTYVANLLEELGCHVIHADRLGHEGCRTFFAADRFARQLRIDLVGSPAMTLDFHEQSPPCAGNPKVWAAQQVSAQNGLICIPIAIFQCRNPIGW